MHKLLVKSLPQLQVDPVYPTSNFLYSFLQVFDDFLSLGGLPVQTQGVSEIGDPSKETEYI